MLHDRKETVQVHGRLWTVTCQVFVAVECISEVQFDKHVVLGHYYYYYNLDEATKAFNWHIENA